MSKRTYTDDEARQMLRLWSTGTFELSHDPWEQRNSQGELRQLVLQVLDATEPQPVDAVPGYAATNGEQFAAGGVITETMVAHGLKSDHFHFRDPFRLEMAPPSASDSYSFNLGRVMLSQDAETTKTEVVRPHDEALSTATVLMHELAKLVLHHDPSEAELIAAYAEALDATARLLIEGNPDWEFRWKG